MQGADIFRWALTGGNRTDTPKSFTDGGVAQTILERAYAARQGEFMYQFPNKNIYGKDILNYTNPGDYGASSGAVTSGSSPDRQRRARIPVRAEARQSGRLHLPQREGRGLP